MSYSALHESVPPGMDSVLCTRVLLLLLRPSGIMHFIGTGRAPSSACTDFPPDSQFCYCEGAAWGHCRWDLFFKVAGAEAAVLGARGAFQRAPYSCGSPKLLSSAGSALPTLYDYCLILYSSYRRQYADRARVREYAHNKRHSGFGRGIAELT
jgi:hypothetical protein